MSHVHWISPYRADKNIGGAINVAICNLNPPGEYIRPDDWVVHTDQDCLFLQPDTKAHILNILDKTSYDVLGCLTNRIRSKEQLVNGYFNGNPDITYHMGVAQRQWDTHGMSIRPARGVIAAFLLCFRVSTWEQLGGFDEGSLSFDSTFSMRARKAGLKLGIMQGIVVWHSYRLRAVDPFREINHLL